MKLLDSRRLVGPNAQMERAGVLAEVEFEPGEDAERALAAWREQVGVVNRALGLAWEDARVRRFVGGAALTFVAPLDLLLGATDANELAIARASGIAQGRAPPALDAIDEPLAPLRLALAMQRSPRLRALEREAKQRGVPLLWDDATLSLGLGKRSRGWALEALPAVDEVPWSALGSIPVALITGTNGKTTTARLLAKILATSGLRTGLAATGFVAIDGEVAERGDFTGPAAARLVLRDPRVEIAVLETARGGILRRGLAIASADCALITNVADDHLGEYGIDSVRALARAKAVVASVVKRDGRIVLNADDPELVALAREEPQRFPARIIWTSLRADNAVVHAHLAAGGEVLLLEEAAPGDPVAPTLSGEPTRRSSAAGRAQLVHRSAQGREVIIAAREIPIALGGAALHNVSNALGAAALALALGMTREAIAHGLAAFRPDPQDNPGRGNLFEGHGVRVLADFGHNAHAVKQIGGLVQALRAKRPGASSDGAGEAQGELAPAGGALFVLAACAGDRSDENIRALSQEISAMQPQRVLLRDLPDYLRGRQPNEVPLLMTEQLVALGVARDRVAICPNELAALEVALEAAKPGDLVLMLVHLEEEATAQLLAQRGFRPV